MLALLWGSSFLWIKVSLRSFEPGQVLFGRLALGAMGLVCILYASRRRLPTGSNVWLHLAVAALVGNVVPYFLFAVAEQDIDSAVAGMLNAMTPVWTLLLAFAIRQTTRLTATQAVGVVLGLVGTVLIFAPWDRGTQFSSLGAIWCLVAAFSYGVSYVYMAHFLAPTGVDPVSLSAGQLIAASVLAIPVMLNSSGGAVPELRLDAVGSLAILGILGTGLAYVLNYRIIADEGAVAASIVIYLLPVVAIVLGVVTLDESLTTSAAIGILIVIIGVAATRTPSRGL